MKKVLFTGESHPAIAAIAARLEREGWQVMINRTHDLTTEREAKDLAKEVGDIDAMVVCDRFLCRASLAEQDDYEKIVASAEKAIMSAFCVCKTIGGEMAKNGGKSIVFLSSIHADKASGAQPGYAVAQGALQMMMRELALFYGHYGVRTNMVKLAPTQEEIQDFDSDTVSVNYDVTTKSPAHRHVTGTDAAGIVSLLLSEDGAGMNGGDYRIDGGQTLYYYDRAYPELLK